MKRVGLYIRVSTEEQARIQDGSLVSQRQRLLEYVEGQNRRDAAWGQVVDVYCDEGKSAKDMNRPEFQRLIGDIRTGKISLVLSTELSRMSRSIRDFCELWDIFKKHNASFITLREQFDTTSAAGEMMVFNLINFAQFERKQTAERISANWLSRAKRGLWNGGSIPLGYDRNPKNPGELLPSPEESKQVKEIFHLFLETGSVRKTCQELSKRGMFSKKFTNKHGLEKGGGHFTVPSLFRILTNRAYIGLREIGKANGITDVVKASWKPIIDFEIFNQVQEKLSSNKNKFKPDEWKRYPYPLTELLICGECGKHLGGKSAHGKNRKHFYYGHPRQINSDGISHLKRCLLERVRAERIEDIVLHSMKTLLQKPGLMEHWLEIYAKSANHEVPALEGRLKSVESDIHTNETRAKNLVARISDLPQEVSADMFIQQIKELNEKVKNLKIVKDDLQARAKVMNGKIIDREAFERKITRTIANLESVPVEHRKPIYQNILKFAELHPKKTRIALYAPTKGLEGPDNLKATGTEGVGFSKISSGEPGSLIALATRGGSTSVTIGAQDRNRTCTLLHTRP
jgi:site-specific DNA recombinase